MRLTFAPTVLWLLLGALSLPAQAVDLAWSGFATLGYARSDSTDTYQRFIDRSGTIERDSVLAGQLDARFDPHWSATVQVRVAPSNTSDTRWAVEPSWAFVAWRPDNDWLLRAGKLRVPLHLDSETLDVGAATEMLRLPAEQYWIAPTNDFIGLSGTRSWTVGNTDVSLDAYSGYANTTSRSWTRNGLPPVVSPGAYFTDVHVNATGLVLTARQPDLLWRVGAHATRTQRSDGAAFPVQFPRVELAPGLGYWQVNGALPGPGIPSVYAIHNTLLTAGMEWQIGQGWRLAAEGAKIVQRDTQLGVSMETGYLALFKTVDRWTGYASAARMLSGRRDRAWKQQLTQELLPQGIPGADQINAAQILAGDTLSVFDQRTVALGVSYALTPSSRLKAEWARSHIGSGSAMMNPGPGKPWPRDVDVNVLSVSYSIAF
jgi:hypothetical protein